MEAILKTDLAGLQLFNRGKVRDIYEVDEHLLIVTTDRISAFDVVMPNGIPDKGKVLTALTLFWLTHLKGIVQDHLVSAHVEAYPPEAQVYSDILQGRSMLVRKAKPLPVECVVRGYLAGSAWKEYQKGGKVCGVALPTGMQQSERLPEPIFSPSTKAEVGHDENITYEDVVEMIGVSTAAKIRDLSLTLYNRAAEHALTRGVILADTKFEFGILDGEIALIDEVLTPDSSRFWLVSEYEPGRPQNAFDKQYLRDWLETLDWDKTPPGPNLPDDVVMQTRQRYLDAYELITGKAWRD